MSWASHWGWVCCVGPASFIEVERTVVETEDTAAACQRVFERLCRVPHIDQKIAAMFMKFVVNVFGMWPFLRPHLYVPLDRVVLKLLRDKLAFGADLPANSPVVKNVGKRLRRRDGQPVAEYRRFLDIQERLGEAARIAGADRIAIDELWLVGQLFCHEYPLCHACWLRECCADRQP